MPVVEASLIQLFLFQHQC